MVPVVLRSIWFERNKRIFENFQESLDDILDSIKYRVAYWLSGHWSLNVVLIWQILMSMNIMGKLLFIGFSFGSLLLCVNYNKKHSCMVYYILSYWLEYMEQWCQRIC